MQIYPNPVANVAAKVPGLVQAAAALQFAASPLFNSRQGVYQTGEGSPMGLGAVETWRSTSPPPVLGHMQVAPSMVSLGAYETWRTSGLGQVDANGEVVPEPVPDGNGGTYMPEPFTMDPLTATLGVGGATVALTLGMGLVGAVFGAMHGWQRHKKPGWMWLWGGAGFLFPGYTIAAGIAQKQVTGWRRARA